MGAATVTVDKAAEENGLANMLADLISQNLERCPERMPAFHRMRGRVVIVARDIDVTVTLDFDGGRLTVYDGERGKPKLKVTTDSDTVLDLSKLKVKMGLPFFFDEVGVGVLKKIFNRDLVICGMVTNFFPLARLTSLISIH
ncbi:MAG: SCP2 sterol-binding domain-containing protein [Deltaproteobacteria bacterium]|nr:SCP2 sterol-binding domain-containing protein [Deltaproteobacteria bacterium]